VSKSCGAASIREIERRLREEEASEVVSYNCGASTIGEA